MEIKLQNSEQTAELIPHEKTVALIKNMNFVETFGLAWKGFVPWEKDGICQLNLINGEFQSISLGDDDELTGTDAVGVVCYRIESTDEFSADELLDEYENEDFQESGKQLTDWMDREGIDYVQRVKEAAQIRWDDGEHDDWVERAIAALPDWYSPKN